MRPLELRVQGFTCFAEPMLIDFTDMDVFVISGPTGAGKSTIIDAICYALYGRVPRGTDNTSLVSNNRESMSVDLVFEAGGRRYRVHRGITLKRKTARDGKSESVTRDISPVQLERYDGDAWEPIEGRVRGIDEEIERAIGLDFASFTRCVLLPQGQFQEFLTGGAKERREILIELLSLGIYERVMKAANDRGRSLKERADGYQQRLDEDYADATPEALDALRGEIGAAKPKLDAARAFGTAIDEARQCATAVRAARKREKERNEQQEAKLAEIAAAEELSRAGQSQVAAMTAAVKKDEAELAGLAYEREAHAALIAARGHAHRVAQLTRDAETANAAAANAAGVEQAEVAAAEAAKQRDETSAALQAAEELLIGAQRADMAASVRGGLKPGDPCPVCGGVVGKLPKTAKSAEADAMRARDKARATDKSASDVASRAMQALVRERQKHDGAAADAERCARDLAAAQADLKAALPPGVTADVNTLDAQVLEMDRRAAAREELAAKIDGKRQQRDELAKLVGESAQHLAAMHGEARGLADEAAAARAEGDASMKTLLAIATERALEDVAQSINAKRDPSPLLETVHNDLSAEIERRTRAIAKLEHDEKRVETAITKAAELRETMASIREQATLCGELGTLLRANNFQSYVLEEAMRSLSESATEHLTTLYPRFEITESKGEFLVRDAWQAGQVRPAKTLSGGETFVASLALALALAERLPELQSSTAAALDSLFLDEGFGTLDPETLETVISALEGLRSEERMVGIITHVPELSQRIESRIEVRKAQDGSTVLVNGVDASIEAVSAGS